MPHETPPSDSSDPRAVPQSQCFGGAFIRGYRRVRQVASGKRAEIFSRSASRPARWSR